MNNRIKSYMPLQIIDEDSVGKILLKVIEHHPRHYIKINIFGKTIRACARCLGLYIGIITGFFLSAPFWLGMIRVDNFYLIANGEVNAFTGDLDDYEKWLLQQIRSDRAESKQQRKLSRQQTKALEQKQRELKMTASRCERQLEKFAEELDGVMQQLADPALYEEGADASLQQNLLPM